MYLEFIFLLFFCCLPSLCCHVGGGGSESGAWTGTGVSWIEEVRVSYGEGHLDLQMKNTPCSRNVSGEAGRLGRGREGDALKSVAISSESLCV